MTTLMKLVILPIIVASSALGGWLLNTDAPAPAEPAITLSQAPPLSPAATLAIYAPAIPVCTPACDLRLVFPQGR